MIHETTLKQTFENGEKPLAEPAALHILQIFSSLLTQTQTLNQRVIQKFKIETFCPFNIIKWCRTFLQTTVMCCEFNVYFTYSSICQCYVVTTLLFGWVKARLGLGKDNFMVEIPCSVPTNTAEKCPNISSEITFTNTEQNRGHWHGSLLLGCHAATSRHNVPTSKYPHTHVIWTLYDTYCRNTDMLYVIWCLQIWTYGKTRHPDILFWRVWPGT